MCWHHLRALLNRSCSDYLTALLEQMLNELVTICQALRNEMFLLKLFMNQRDSKQLNLTKGNKS